MFAIARRPPNFHKGDLAIIAGMSQQAVLAAGAYLERPALR
jgi:hypothetical protein